MARYNLFLDDRRTPTSDPRVVTMDSVYKDLNWTVVKNYNEFVDYITRYGLPTVISFDHDLSKEHVDFYFANGGHLKPPTNYLYDLFKDKTGKQCADWLVEYCHKNNLSMPTCYVHSANPTGRLNILKVLEGA